MAKEAARETWLTPRAMASIGIGLLGTVIFALAINNILDTGTCGSGTPFEELQECPEGDAIWVILLPAGFVIFMAGLFTSKEGLVEPGSGQIVWTLFFAGIGLTLLVKAIVQDSLDADARLAAYIVAGVLIPMGAGVAIAGVVQLRRRSQERSRRHPTRG